MTGLVNITTKMFFDREKVVKALEKKEAKVMSATGAFSRQVMKRGMRKRKGISPEGGYPYSHSGELRDLIYFGLDPDKKGLVVGPTFFKKDRETTGSSKTVPQLINEGGTVFRVRKIGRGRKAKIVGKHVRQTYRPRPFVALTLPIATAKFAENMEKFELK